MGTALDFYTAVYTSDDSNQYSVKINKELYDDGNLGFGATDLTKPLMPRGMRMRYIQAYDSSGNARRIWAGTSTCDAWTRGGTPAITSIDLKTKGATTAVTFNLFSNHPEKPADTPHVITNK